jgi:hypothetical protein
MSIREQPSQNPYIVREIEEQHTLTLINIMQTQISAREYYSSSWCSVLKRKKESGVGVCLSAPEIHDWSTVKLTAISQYFRLMLASLIWADARIFTAKADGVKTDI